ncbi:MAG: beta-ketoacyl-ACP synthase 3, partial [Verrucomicrobiae bacterium]|nr:beta-ketoacyl-ACP synthase 3 [Verrucomicrobiae bacterium]
MSDSQPSHGRFRNPRAQHNFIGRTCSIVGVGSYLPERILTNADLEKMVETSDDWITSRTGIKERRIAAEGETTSDLAAAAARRALENAGVTAAEIDLIIVATVTPDMVFPATACLVQAEIGATRAWGFDLSAACSGFLFALSTGATFITSGKHKKVLVIGADKMSSIVDYTDRTTCVLFGDGAGAVLLEADTEGYGIVDSVEYTDGSNSAALCMAAGGSLHPASHETVDARQHFVYQDGKTVFKYAVT